MRFPLIVLAGGSTQANTDARTYLRHRDGLDLGKADWKDVHARFDGRHALDIALDTYREVGYDPITVCGDPGLDEILENTACAQLILAKSTLGEKLQHLDSLVDQELVTLVTKDIIPEPGQLEEYKRLTADHASKDAIIPMVEGRLLVERGFREHIRNKTYVARNAEGVDVLAFPQAYSLRPHRMNLDAMRYTADIFFPFRGNGINLELALTGLSKLLFNPDIRKDVGAFDLARCMGVGLRARYARYEDRGVPGIPILSYDEALDAIAPILQDPDNVNERIAILTTRFDSLAMDFDDPVEAGMVAGYRGLDITYTDTR